MRSAALPARTLNRSGAFRPRSPTLRAFAASLPSCSLRSRISPRRALGLLRLCRPLRAGARVRSLRSPLRALCASPRFQPCALAPLALPLGGVGFPPVPVARSLRAFRRSLRRRVGGSRWSLACFCGGVSWLRSRLFRLGLSFCRVARWFRRCRRPGGARSLGLPWSLALVAGRCGGRRGPPRSPRLGRAGSVFRWRCGGSPARRVRCSASRCRWPSRRRCGWLLPRRCPLRLGCAVSGWPFFWRGGSAAAAAAGCQRRGLSLALAGARLSPRAGGAVQLACAGGAGLPSRPLVRAATRPRWALRSAGAAACRSRRAAVSAHVAGVWAACVVGSACASRPPASRSAARWAVVVASASVCGCFFSSAVAVLAASSGIKC